MGVGIPRLDAFEHCVSAIGLCVGEIVFFAFVPGQVEQLDGFVFKCAGLGLGVLHHEFPRAVA